MKGKGTTDDQVKKCQLMTGLVAHFAEMSENRDARKKGHGNFAFTLNRKYKGTTNYENFSWVFHVTLKTT